MRLLKTKPYGFQARGASFAVSRDSCALIMDAGTGKTLTAFLALARRWKKQRISRVLIHCPKTVVGVWERQAKQHLNIPHTFSRTLEEFKVNYDQDKLNILALGYEATWRVEKKLRRIEWCISLSDESHRLRNRGSKQSKSVGRIGRHARYRMILTGTPIGENEIDFWAQFRFLDSSVFGEKWGPFDKKWLAPTGYGGFDRKFRKSRREPFLHKIEPYVYRVPKSVLGLPKEIHTDLPVALEPKTMKLYRQLEDKFYAELKGHSITTELKITNILRLQQIVGGFLKDDDGHIHQVSTAKLDVLLDSIEAIDLERFKCVTFCRFTDEVDLIASNLKNVDVLDGRTKNPDRVWMTFQDKKYPRQLVVQEETGGIGIDLFAANYGLFYSVTYSWIAYMQAISRVSRKGQKQKMTFSRLIGENTVDEDIWQAVDKKGETANLALREFNRRRS